MYWITTLDSICITLGIVMIFGILGTVAFVAFKIRAKMYDEEDDCEIRKVLKYLSVFPIVLVFTIIGLVFIPNTKQALVIYGVGGTLEYLESNDKAKQIPDKAIECLNMYFDNIIKEQEQQKTNN